MQNGKNHKTGFFRKALHALLLTVLIAAGWYVLRSLTAPVQIGNSAFVEPTFAVYIADVRKYQKTRDEILAAVGVSDYVYYCTPDGEWHGGKFDSAKVDAFGRVHLTIEGVERVLNPEDVQFAKLEGRNTQWTEEIPLFRGVEP